MTGSVKYPAKYHFGEEETYYVFYNYLGKECVMSGTAFDEAHARELFEKKMDPLCEIKKVMNSEQYAKEISDKILKDVVKVLSDSFKPDRRVRKK